MRKKFTFTLDSGIYENFQKFCSSNAYKMSAKLELLMKEEIEQKRIEHSSYITLVKLFQDMIQEQSEKPKQKVVRRTIEVERSVFQPTKSNIPVGIPSLSTASVNTNPNPMIYNPKKIRSKKPIPTLDQLRVRRGI